MTSSNKKIIGIYRIINPMGKIYIGQSTNIYHRLNSYSKLRCKYQPKIYRSIKKYGWKNHKVSILKECSILELNKYERLFGERYNVLSKYNLNLQLPEFDDKPKIYSAEAKLKMRNSQLGKKMSNTTKLKIANSNKGKNLTELHKLKISESNKGKIRTNESKLKQAESRRGKYTGKNCPSSKRIGKLNPNWGRTGSKHPMSRSVINTLTNETWVNAKECALDNNIPQSTLTKKLNGTTRNNTNFKYK